MVLTLLYNKIIRLAYNIIYKSYVFVVKNQIFYTNYCITYL